MKTKLLKKIRKRFKWAVRDKPFLIGSPIIYRCVVILDTKTMEEFHFSNKRAIAYPSFNIESACHFMAMICIWSLRRFEKTREIRKKRVLERNVKNRWGI